MCRAILLMLGAICVLLALLLCVFSERGLGVRQLNAQKREDEPKTLVEEYPNEEDDTNENGKKAA